MAHVDHLTEVQSHPVDDFTDHRAPRPRTLEGLRLAGCGAIVGVALVGVFTKNAPDIPVAEFIAAAVGAAVVGILFRFARIF